MWLKALLGEGVALDGGATAIACNGTGMTYTELAAKSDRLAAALAGHGVRPGDRVVLFMDTSTEGIVAMLAVLKAGAVLTPVAPTTDAEDLAFVFDDCRASAVVTQARLGPIAAAAMRRSCSVRLVVLAGGDQSSVSDTCLSYEDVVNRRRGADLPASPAGDHAVLLVYPRTPGGLRAPVTMTRADVLAATADAAAGGAAAPVVTTRRFVGARGLAEVLAALTAGATLVIEREQDASDVKPALAG